MFEYNCGLYAKCRDIRGGESWTFWRLRSSLLRLSSPWGWEWLRGASWSRPQVSGSLLVRESVPQMYSDDPEELEESLQWVESNIHLPPWAERQQTSFGEALVYQVARLAAAHVRLAAAVERLGPTPSADTHAGRQCGKLSFTLHTADPLTIESRAVASGPLRDSRGRYLGTPRFAEPGAAQ